ncbi:endonuclease/exonuclease/phosphatase family protein [Formosa sp. A9]|uniref:endonuclease/exonuclease/phosphatase family protein n=1 Tax=Formosa sp. A9 TaxID=3442641 RepID=UPI003EBED2FE
MKSRFILLQFFILYVFHAEVKAQQRHFKVHTIAFYNLENTFDTEDDPLKFDESSPIMEISHHRDTVYQKKIENMARVINDIGLETTHKPPAIIGVCEIENRKVLEQIINTEPLTQQHYGIIHFDSPDARGIDVALLYDKDVFRPQHYKNIPLLLYDTDSGKRIYTRDALLVSGFLEDDLIHIIVNHWPSRRGGETASNFKRLRAAQLNKHLIDSLQNENPYAKIIIMGDLNDNPTDDSLKTVLHTENRLKETALKGIYNPMEKLYNKGLGTTAYRDKWSLFDQILMSHPLLNNDYTSFRFYKAGIFNPDYLITSTGSYKGYPFRSFSNQGFTGGYSDHFPVYIYLIKEITTIKKSD